MDDVVFERNKILAFGLVLSFLFLILSVSAYYSYQHEVNASKRLDPNSVSNMSVEEIQKYIVERRNNENVLKLYYFFPFSGLLGVIVGVFSFYILSKRFVEKEKILKDNSKIILNFLNPYEKKVVLKLLEHEGKLRQYDLKYYLGLDKVKTHRIINSLEEKGVVFREKLGKVNNIVLKKELYELLKK